MEITDLSDAACTFTATVATITRFGLGTRSEPIILESMGHHSLGKEIDTNLSVEKELFSNPSQHYWIVYILVPTLLVIIAVLAMYMRGYIRCHKSPLTHQTKCHTPICSPHCHTGMYTQQIKSNWPDSPQIQQNTCLLRHNLYVNEYAEPNNLQENSSDRCSPYTTTAIVSPRNMLRCYSPPLGFLPPPPPSCPPPPISPNGSGSSATCSSDSSCGSYGKRLVCVRRDGQASPCDHMGVYRPILQMDLSEYKRPVECYSDGVYEHNTYATADKQPDMCNDLSTTNCNDLSNCTNFTQIGSNDRRSSFEQMENPSNVLAQNIKINNDARKNGPDSDSFPTFTSIRSSNTSSNNSEHRL